MNHSCLFQPLEEKVKLTGTHPPCGLQGGGKELHDLIAVLGAWHQGAKNNKFGGGADLHLPSKSKYFIAEYSIME
jgi:hypothetical protein